MTHLCLRVQQTIVEIDVEHEGSILHLLAGYLYCFLIALFLNQSQELTGTGHVTALADIDKPHFSGEGEGRKTRERQQRILGRIVYFMALCICRFSLDCLDMFVCGATASSDDVHKSFFQERTNVNGHQFGRLIILPKLVGQTCIGVGTNINRFARVRIELSYQCLQLAQVRQHIRSAERTVQTNAEQLWRVSDGDDESVKCLSAEQMS